MPRALDKALTENLVLRRQVERLQEQVKALKAKVAELKRQLSPGAPGLEQQVKALEAEVAELKQRLQQNSQNSSLPPSRNPLHAAKRPWKRASGRKRGGQPGHAGHHRPLLPVDQVQGVVPIKPSHCQGCGLGLLGEDASPERHQVTEFPKVVAQVTEYQLHTLYCPHCRTANKATWPSDVPRGAFGPTLLAFLAFASGVLHLSKRATVGLLRDWFQVDISLGSVSACETITSEVIAPAVAEAHEYAKKQPIAYADETGWFEGLHRTRAWLWTVVTPLVTVFRISKSRGREAAKALLGDFAGILVTDRWHAYTVWAVEKRQLCWAHLLRLWVAVSEREGEVAKLGSALLVETCQMFRWFQWVRDGTLSRTEFQVWMVSLKARFEEFLEQGAGCAHAKTARQCRKVLKLHTALWTFVQVEGVEPTNNTAEIAVRQGVLWRKLSLGTQSEAGSLFVARIMTVAATLKQQRRNITDYLIQAHKNALGGQPVASLLPEIPPAPGLSVAA